MRTFTGMAVAAALPRLGVALLLATAGCKSKALQELDGGGIGGLGGIGAGGFGAGEGGAASGGAGGFGGGWQDGGGPVDRSLDVPFAGQRSFIVTADVLSNNGSFKASHVFTMTLDAAQRTAVIGVPGGGATRTVEEIPGALRITGASFGVPVSAACGGAVRYERLDFEVHASGSLAGAGSGTLTTYDADNVAQELSVTTLLTGVPDAEPPTLSLAAGGDLSDPWTSLFLVASEPLRERQMMPVLRSTGGDVIAFDAVHTADAFVSVFSKPTRMLRFGDQYSVTFEGITDLAGNALLPAAPPMFTTRAAPPLVAADGFESITDATLGGAQVLSGAGAPVIAGARSLYIPPAASLGPSGRQTQLVVRLAVATGQRFVRFDYRTVNPSAGQVTWLVAGVGGSIEAASPLADVGAPTTPATIAGTDVALGATTRMEILIPGDARGEIVVARVVSQSGGGCGAPPPPPVPGAIVDNLRVE